MAAEWQTYGGKGSPLGEHFCNLRRQVGGGRHQDLTQVPSPCGGLLCRPTHTEKECDTLVFQHTEENEKDIHTSVSFTYIDRNRNVHTHTSPSGSLI